MNLKNFLLTNPVGSSMLAPVRFKRALGYFPWSRIATWSLFSGELANFTYDLTEMNVCYLIQAVAAVLQREYAEVAEIASEAQTDFHGYQIGRRLGWYLFARLLKPALIIETGVDKGLGSIILCSALLRNGSGHYIGTDKNPKAGELLRHPYNSVGEILYGDSLESLATISEPIDLFINDSDHSADYESREYDLVSPNLSPKAVILGDNSHVTDALARFSIDHGRRFVFFKEQPANHWYPGAGIGISYC